MHKFMIRLCAAMFLLLVVPFQPRADEFCTIMGALAWDDWTSNGAGGGNVLPTGEKNKDYLRCKACHGWDRLGLDGGYARRSRNESRPNAGYGDGDLRSRNISTGSMGGHGPITAEMILHAGVGRSLSNGTGSWVALEETPNALNTAEYQRGYTLGNQHPDFSTLLTEKQIACLVEFLNSNDSQPDQVFAEIVPTVEPVIYRLHESADSAAGKVFYETYCWLCHGQPDNDQSDTEAGAPSGGFVAYLAEEGHFSEIFHKARWGIPGTDMERAVIGNPGSGDVANLLKYLQEYAGISTDDFCGRSLPVFSNSKSTLHVPRFVFQDAVGDFAGWGRLLFLPEGDRLLFEVLEYDVCKE